jgi:acetyl-CoA acyltransferase
MEAYIIKAYRSAIGKSGKGGFKNFRSDDLAIRVISHLMAEVPEILPEMIDDVIVGCAYPEAEQAGQIGRQISLRSLGISVPGITINRYCASGLEAIAMAVGKIRGGMGHCFIAGGVESMSLIPRTGWRYTPSYELASKNPEYMVGMGLTAEAIANKYRITRKNADEFAYNSHRKAGAAIAAGKFRSEIVPIEVPDIRVIDNKKVSSTHIIDTDEGVRNDTSLEVLSKLRPVFANGGIVTAGNSSQTSDGAAFHLVVSEVIVKRFNLKPIARLITSAVGGVDPLLMGIGPCVAIPKALKQAGMKLSDIQQIELNEAFAVQALAVIQEAGLDPDIVNLNGGAVALGHPLGCTGAILSMKLLNEMRRRNQKYGMVTSCVGGGQGIAGIFELFN